MMPILNNEQLQNLKKVLNECLNEEKPTYYSNVDVLKKFSKSKELEGCSKRTIVYYETTIRKLFECLNKNYLLIETDDLRNYLTNYENNSKAGKITIDNIRRIVSSFFNWLEEEDYIIKNPMKRIHKIKCIQSIKNPFNDEEIETIRENASTERDLAIIDFLLATGVRVSELTNLKISDIDFNKREVIVLGKGNKERKVFFDAKTKIHLENYIRKRNDITDYLFVSQKNPKFGLGVRGIQRILQKIGKKCLIHEINPHKFRRTMATNALNKGIPIDEVRILLGHNQIQTTLRYAITSIENVRTSYNKLFG